MAGHPGSGLYHLACIFTGKAHCYCPHGAAVAPQPLDQRTHCQRLIDMFREAAGAVPGSRPKEPMPSGSGPSSELLLPRLYRNPQNLDLGNDTPVLIGDELITRNQALARLDECMLEARKLTTEAVQLALYGGLDYHPPPEVGVDPANFPRPNDLRALQRIASGAVVADVKAGKLTPGEEQQLLGLTDEEYQSLSSIRAAASQPGPSSHGGGRETDGSSAGKHGKPELLKIKDIKPNLKGREILIQTPNDNQNWHRSTIIDINAKNRTALLSFPGMTQTVTINLGDTIREKRMAWVDGPPAEGSSGSGAAAQQQQQQHMSHQAGLQRQMEQHDRSLSGNSADRANAQRAGDMYGYGMQPQHQQQPPQQMMNPPEAPARHSPTVPRSMVEAIVAVGHKAVGAKVEVTLVSSGQRRTGVVTGCCLSPKFISVDFGNVKANLTAQEEFNTYTLRVMQ
mmetsp:Transcript_20445/g.56668  ORF Transcript_20445/g.56668 Transcript_20445/m.56668 type:complete len:454 (-) Transcript_20445:280-1641(-)